MASKNSSDLVYVVLNITQGKHFDCWRKIRLRIAPSLDKQLMVSEYILAIAEPIFNLYFVWCMTESHFRLLQSQKQDIQVGVVAERAGKTYTAGCAKLGIQHAQLTNPHTALYSRQLPIQVIKSPEGAGLQPELVVTLAVHSVPPVDKHAQIYIAYLTEPQEAKQPRASTNSLNGGILRRNDTTPSTSKNVELHDSSECVPSRKPSERKQSRVTDTTTKSVRFQDER